MVLAFVGLVGLLSTTNTTTGHMNESSPIGSLKAIATAQVMFSQADKDGDGVANYAASLADLSSQACGSLIDSTLGAGRKTGYVFELRRAPDAPTQRWMAIARPITPGTTGDRSFVVNQEGAVFFTTGAPFELTDDCAIPARAVPLSKR